MFLQIKLALMVEILMHPAMGILLSAGNLESFPVSSRDAHGRKMIEQIGRRCIHKIGSDVFGDVITDAGFELFDYCIVDLRRCGK